MHLIRPATLDVWLVAARPLLQAQEARHSLMLGVATAGDLQPDACMALVEEAGQIVAASLRSRDHLLLSDGPGPAFRRLAEDPAALDANTHGLRGPPDSVSAVLAASRRPWHVSMQQGIYELRQVVPPPSTPGQMRASTPADRDLIAQWLMAFHTEALPGGPATAPQTLSNADAMIGAGRSFVWTVAGRPVAHAATAGPPDPPAGGVGGASTPCIPRQSSVGGATPALWWRPSASTPWTRALTSFACTPT